MCKTAFLFFFLFNFSILINAQTDDELRALISRYQPLKGGIVPRDIKNRLGTTHTGGKYFLTEKPFIIEGADKIEELGLGVFKVFLSRNMDGLPYNSEWNLSGKSSYTDVVKHPYFQEVFNKNFSTFILNISDHGGQLKDQKPDFSQVSSELYELGVYLLTQYGDRNITFILKNWEGDWMLRGGFLNKSEWIKQGKDAHRLKVNNFVLWTKSRQDAVSNARSKVKNSKAKLFLSIEANKVIESMNGIPGIANAVLPELHVDMVSWSCYDGMSSPVLLYKGLQYLREQMRPTPYMKGEKKVFLGEIGIPEKVNSERITERWDEFFGVCFALDIPYVIHWELYCNEPVDGKQKQFYPTRTEDELRGFWLIKPDGSKSETYNYFEKLLDSAGKLVLN